ncbi:unc (munc) [Echinococcus multilocularis]|uniref:Unc munc n=1 Tax=Echinococcus multilocularis TaxID=6211 RepID=A0A0S4MJC3_ECHMU|nr:unc (munc) [Echinococcus multilocularis]
MVPLTESRASSVATETMEEKEGNSEEELAQSGASSAKVEIKKEGRGEEEEDETTPDEASNLATVDSFSENVLQTGMLVVE